MKLEVLLLFAASVISIASNSIGIQAIGQTDPGTRAHRNKTFLIILLIISILVLLVSSYLIFSKSKRAV